MATSAKRVIVAVLTRLPLWLARPLGAVVRRVWPGVRGA